MVTQSLRTDRLLPAVFSILVAVLMFATVFHPYLWGPDEPREAEISREMYVTGNYVTPHFCGQPFVEKPPLYFIAAAGVFHLTGGPSPQAARCVSAFFGCLMLAAVGFLGFRSRGLRGAFLSVLLLLGMPQFYRAAHWILLDIALGAFITAAAGCFAVRLFWSRSANLNTVLRLIFWLCCAGAFLTKGVFGVIYIGFIVGSYVLIRRRWDLIREFLFDWTVLLFLIPVGTWVFLFWMDGGAYYLHEHFINNTIGRFLHKQFKLPGSPDYFTDVGNPSPWHFYLGRLPNMFALALVPGLAAGAGELIRRFRPQGNSRWERFLAPYPQEDRSAEWRFYLWIWFLVPLILLSIPAAKEVTYILPGYAALALLSMEWIDPLLPPDNGADLAPSLWIAGLMALPVVASYWIPAGYSIAGTVVLLVIAFLLLILHAWKRRFSAAVYLILTAVVCGVVLGNTPEVMRKTRLNRKNLYDTSPQVWSQVGNRKLVLYSGDETFRGSIPFYGSRTTPAIKNEEKLMKTLVSEPETCLLLYQNRFQRMSGKSAWKKVFKRYRVIPVSRKKLYEDFILLIPAETSSAGHTPEL